MSLRFMNAGLPSIRCPLHHFLVSLCFRGFSFYGLFSIFGYFAAFLGYGDVLRKTGDCSVAENSLAAVYASIFSTISEGLMLSRRHSF